MTIPYVYVPITALFCYLFLLLAFAAAKKNRAIYSFMGLLVCYALWTGGSMLMRILFYPGYRLWYEISLFSLFATPLFLYNFVCDFLERKGYLLKKVWLVLTVLIIVLTHFEVFLKVPELVSLGNGRAVFLYHIEAILALPVSIFFLMILSTGFMAIQALRKNAMIGGSLMPILIGMMILFVGNILSVLPNNIFPWDTLAGIIDAGFMVYALYKKRMLKLTFLVSRGTMLVLSTLLASLLFINLMDTLESAISQNFPQFGRYQTLTIAICFSLLIFCFYKLFQRISNNLFVREEQIQAQQLKDFSVIASKSLNLDEILVGLVKVVQNAVGIEKVYVCLLDREHQCYRLARSASPLDPKAFSLSLDNPCALWFHTQDSCLLLKEFQATALYKSMWESEKRQLKDLDIECMVPLKCEDGLVGILLLSKKIKNQKFSFDNITFLESVGSIASIAIKNANLYKAAYLEARTDNLTNLYNRKFFYEEINELFEKAQEQSLALIIMNVDDFKLYNQLYGNREGDLALQKIAEIISRCVGKNGFAARYSGKEFAIVLPYYNAMQALELTQDIQRQASQINKGSAGEILKTLTFSSGICVYPYAASDVKQLIENADMAVYSAKRTGKNKIVTYSRKSSVTDGEGGAAEIKNDSYSEYASTIYALTAAIDAKDHYTFSHSQKVAEYSTILARAMGLDPKHVQLINEAALLHDIGKIAIPEAILTKPGKLTAEEYKIMQTHVEHSVAMIRHLPSLNYVIPAAIGHHERWDGKGYPRGIAGEDIPVSARCLAIADAFDAMTAVRPYKEPLPAEIAIQEIEKQSGLQFDPKIVKIFARLVRAGKIQVEMSCDSVKAQS